MVDTLYDCAKFRYECGNYSEASEYLYFYRVLVSTFAVLVSWSTLSVGVCLFLCQAPSDHKNLMSAKWGKLSCAVLAQDWDSALEELNKLKRDIDETVCLCVHVCVWVETLVEGCVSCQVSNHLMRLQYRAWLIHWSLFVYFNHPKGQDEIIKIFLYEQE